MTEKAKTSAPYDTQIGPVEPRYLNGREAARYLGLGNAATLSIWRRRGYGPPFVAIGRRGSNRYLYDKHDLDKWIQDQKLYPQRPHALESYRGSGSNRKEEVSAKKPPRKRAARKQEPIPLHKVFRTVAEEPPGE